MLKENISNLPVVIIENSILKGIIDLKTIKFKVIQYSSLGNENGILLGFKPDYIKIYTDENCHKKEVIIGIYQGKLCDNSNEYNAIVGI